MQKKIGILMLALLMAPAPGWAIWPALSDPTEKTTTRLDLTQRITTFGKQKARSLAEEKMKEVKGAIGAVVTPLTNAYAMGQDAYVAGKGLVSGSKDKTAGANPMTGDSKTTTLKIDSVGLTDKETLETQAGVAAMIQAAAVDAGDGNVADKHEVKAFQRAIISDLATGGLAKASVDQAQSKKDEKRIATAVGFANANEGDLRRSVISQAQLTLVQVDKGNLAVDRAAANLQVAGSKALGETIEIDPQANKTTDGRV